VKLSCGSRGAAHTSCVIIIAHFVISKQCCSFQPAAFMSSKFASGSFCDKICFIKKLNAFSVIFVFHSVQNLVFWNICLHSS
jgi:hypothetical protein